ncbi:MAG: carboxypeptidase-like regulatory domain-containing protein [Vicinamibacterales bacterium]
MPHTHSRLRVALLFAVAGALALPWAVSTQTLPRPAAAPAAGVQLPAIDADDIGGVVASDKGPEAGVWVIAETTDLPTRFIRIVVTDEQGRYVVPDLPGATYRVWVRGYGLVDSAPVAGKVGQRLNLTATPAASPNEAAAIYPASYWLSMMRTPTTGPIGQADLTRTIKTCMACHQIGDKATRELPSFLRDKSHLDAWDARVKFGPSGPGMSAQLQRMGTQRSMLAEWTDRISRGAVPDHQPARPRGVERNLVVTMWDWGGAATFAHDEAAGDKRDPRVNANGPIWGPSQFHDTLMWVDPVKHTSGETKIPTTAPLSAGAASPHFGNDVIWRAAAEPRSAAVDEKARVWMAARHRPSDQQPAFCKDGSANRFAKYYPLNTGGKQVSVYDPKTMKFTQIDTCFTADHNDLDEQGRIYFGQNNAVGWIDTRAVDKLPAGVVTGAEAEAVQGWCPGVVDTSGDGVVTAGWTEPADPIDPKRDHRIQFGCYQPGIAPDGSVWCGPGGETDNRIVRVEVGNNPPQTCKAEVYQVPPFRDSRGARGLDVDSSGVVWVNMTATDQFARFDRRKCKVLNGPTAIGQQCPEGWSFFQIPGPPFSGPGSPGGGAVGPLTGRGTGRTTDMMYLTTVDRHDVLGLNNGKDVPFTELGNSDALLAYLPESDQMVTLRVPYPMGFFARSVHGRIDDPSMGWKGRGLWSSFASYAAWHVEGGVGTKSKVVKFQMRETPTDK